MLTPIEIIALILAICGIIKIIFVSANKKAWIKFAAKFYKVPAISIAMLIILGIIVAYYLLLTLSIVQIVASFALLSIIGGIGAMIYSKEILDLANKIAKKKTAFKERAYVFLWLVIFLLVLLAIFA